MALNLHKIEYTLDDNFLFRNNFRPYDLCLIIFYSCGTIIYEKVYIFTLESDRLYVHAVVA